MLKSREIAKHGNDDVRILSKKGIIPVILGDNLIHSTLFWILEQAVNRLPYFRVMKLSKCS